MIQYENYVIVPDMFDCTLSEKGVVESGKLKGQEKLTVIGYFPNIQSCLKRIRAIKLAEGFKETDVNDLDAAIIKIEEIVNKHEETIKELVANLRID